MLIVRKANSITLLIHCILYRAHSEAEVFSLRSSYINICKREKMFNLPEKKQTAAVSGALVLVGRRLPH